MDETTIALLLWPPEIVPDVPEPPTSRRTRPRGRPPAARAGTIAGGGLARPPAPNGGSTATGAGAGSDDDVNMCEDAGSDTSADTSGDDMAVDEQEEPARVPRQRRGLPLGS